MNAPNSGLESILVRQDAEVFREGDPGTCAFLIERGRVAIHIERDGRRIALAERGPGEMFGEMAIIDDKPRTASVSALEDCELLVITREQLNRRIAAGDPILRLCLNIVLDRFRDAMAKLHGLHVGARPNDSDPVGRTLADEYAVAKDAFQEIKLEREIENAIRQQEFELHYQPIVDLGHGDLAGFESLVRWRHADRGLMPPVVFIPTAEASGLIAPMSRLCLTEACGTMADLAGAARTAAAVADDLFFSVNVSGRDFDEPDFVENIAATLARTGADPKRLKLEITETILMQQPDRAATALDRCREMGVQIAIDDFGAGYSSLGYLHRFPIDTLKIDRSFVVAMHEEERSMKIVQSILGMAEKLDVPVVAEGIETEAQADTLRRLGCKYGQGYLFAKPLPRLDAEALIDGWAGRDGAVKTAC